MIRFETVKEQINDMNISEFMEIAKDGSLKEYICGEIKADIAHCTNKSEHSCYDCIKSYLEIDAGDK